MQAVIAELDDLDQERAPEDLMLSYVSDKSGKDRTDRALVAPWFKFLWETYRNILDILRNNVKFTQMYGMVTKQAFQFCRKYERNTEFRRLCEILRNQLLTLRKCAACSLLPALLPLRDPAQPAAHAAQVRSPARCSPLASVRRFASARSFATCCSRCASAWRLLPAVRVYAARCSASKLNRLLFLCRTRDGQQRDGRDRPDLSNS